jgi:hypothetical protein
MKKMKQKSAKIIIALIAIILIAGTIMICTKGLVFGLNYEDSKKVEINLGKQFEEKDIKEITNDVFGKQPVLIQAIEVYKDAVSITTTEITDDQKANLITKLNEKYGTDISTDYITIEANAHIRGRDIVKPYIVYFAIATVIVLVYLSIRYYKLNSLKVLAKSIGIMLLTQLILLAIIAIARIPIGVLTMPVVLLIYVLSTYICTAKFDKDLDKKLQENN